MSNKNLKTAIKKYHTLLLSMTENNVKVILSQISALEATLTPDEQLTVIDAMCEAEL